MTLLDSLSSWYSNCHGYISLIICAIGIPLNIINVVVLTRRKMHTPINFILTCLAISDMATMITYVPFAYHFYCEYSANTISTGKNSFEWMNFLLIHLNFSATAHTISIWLAVALAMIRFHQIHSPAKGNLTRMRRIIRARMIVGIIVVFSVTIMIPNYLSVKLEQYRRRDNTTMYIFEEWHLGTEQAKPIKMIALILYSVLAKLVPCVMIIIYGGLLLRTLRKTMLHQRHLSSTGACLNPQRSNDPARTTTMLLIVIVLFLLTELPQGILIMCCIFIKNFFEKTYIPLGDIMDIIALINNGINFVLYCTMSREFRLTFIDVFCSPLLKIEKPNSHASTVICHKKLQNSTL
jgi:hypothetical protein